MKANELRIGNWVKINDDTFEHKEQWGYDLYKTNEFEITGFNDGSLAEGCKVICFYKIPSKIGGFVLGGCRDLEIEPIPLTEEWLLKFGGIKRFSERSNIIDIKINEETDIVFPFSNTDMIPFIDTYQENYYKEGGDQTIITLINLKHVHQLQNLYFALTGEELELKTKMA